MGVGHILPIEEPLMAEGEGQCSTQVEPSPTQDPHASEEHNEGPQPNEQDQGQVGGDPPNDAQDQVLIPEQVQDQEQAQDDAHDDQDMSPQLSLEEQLECRAAKIASKLKSKEHLMK